MDENDLYLPALSAATDEEVRALFAEASLPSTVTEHLTTFLGSKEGSGPLAVRPTPTHSALPTQPSTCPRCTADPVHRCVCVCVCGTGALVLPL